MSLLEGGVETEYGVTVGLQEVAIAREYQQKWGVFLVILEMH